MNRRAFLALVLLVTLSAGVVLLSGGVLGIASTAGDVGDTAPTVQSDAQVELSCEYPLTVEDGGGTEVTVESEPEAIVALAPSTSQHLWELGVTDRVVGMPVNQYTEYLGDTEGYENVVGEDGQPITETIVALEPDLVIAPEIISDEAVESLRNAGITVYQHDVSNSFEEVVARVERTGQLVGACDRAATVTDDMEATVAALEAGTADEEPKRVLYDLGFGWTAGEDTLENDMLSRVGAENIALEAEESGYFELSEEVIVEQDPEWIIYQSGMGTPDSTAVRASTAYAEDQFVEVDPQLINQHGPRVVEPYERIAEAMWENLDADFEATGDDSDGVADDATGVNGDGVATDDTADTDGTGDDPTEFGPGMTVFTALLALAALVGLVRRAR